MLSLSNPDLPKLIRLITTLPDPQLPLKKLRDSPVTISCFLLICIVDKSERARSTGGRIRMKKDLELGFRTYAVYFHSYHWSPGRPVVSFLGICSSQSHVPGIVSGTLLTQVSISAARHKQALGLD